MKRAFPGERRVWLIGGTVLSIFLIGALVACLIPREHYLGTNSIAARNAVAEVSPGDRLCVPQLDVPDRTGRVRIVAFWDGERRPEFSARLRVGNEFVTGRLPPAAAAPGLGLVDIPVTEVKLDRSSERGELCVTSRGRVSFGGMVGLQGDQWSPTVRGGEIGSRVSVWFLPPVGEQRSALSLAGEVINRAALFRPAPVGPWTYVLLLSLWPALGYMAIRLLATANPRSGVVPTAFAVGLLAFVTAASWSLITPPFDAPDEPDHFSYAQTLAESGRAPEKSPGPRPPFSSNIVAGLDAARLYSHLENPLGRPPWLAIDEQRYRRRFAASRPSSSNGGGFLVSTSTHSPVYYAITLPAYAVAGEDPFARLTLMRMLSALLSVLVAVCAFLTVRELAPGSQHLAVVAGVVVAFQPMFAFISGALNNDTGVNASAALLVYLLVRGLRRGPSLLLGLAIGAVLVMLPLMKATGYTLYPAAVLAVIGMIWRHHPPRHLPGYAGVVASFAGLTALWGAINESLGRTIFTTPGGVSPTASTGVVGNVLNDPVLYLSYLWQVFLPRLPFMKDLFVQRWPAYDIYVERGWAAFGWYAIKFPMWVYVVIALAITTGLILCAAGMWRERMSVRSRGWELAVLLIALAGVIGGVEAAYIANTPRPVVAEQGRYAFAAIVPLAAIAAGGCLAFGRQRVTAMVAALAAAMVGFAFLSQLLALGGFYA